jgi:hypothetical protein
MSYGMPTMCPAREIKERYRVHPETDDHFPMAPGVVKTVTRNGPSVSIELEDGRILDLDAAAQVFTAVWDR